MSNGIKYTLMLGLVGSSFSSVAALQEIQEDSLSEVTGEQGITITTQVPGTLSYDVIYKDTQDKQDLANIILANSGGKDFTVSNMTIDVRSLGDKAALQIGLPSRIEGKEFSMGDVYLSVDDDARLGVSTQLSGQYVDAPVRKTYQAVVTATNYRFDGDGDGKVGESTDRFNPDLGINELELQIQDVGRTSSGNLSGSGQLRVESWHKYGNAQGRVDRAYLTNAENRRSAYALQDRGNQGLEQGLNTGNGIADLQSNEFFFAKGVDTSLSGNASLGVGAGQNSSISDSAAAAGRMRGCDSSGGNCGGNKSSSFDANNGVVKYNINLTSRIDQKDSDKILNPGRYSDSINCTYNNDVPCRNDNRYEGVHPSNLITNGGPRGSNGQGGCYGNNCEARPIVEGVGWYVNNTDYKPVSATEYQQIEANNSGAQMAHDPRVIFSVGKQTEVRIQAFNKKCTRWCGDDFIKNKEPRPAYRQAALDPAVVLLDDAGNVIAADLSSGGATKINGQSQSINGSKAVSSNTDDHEYYPMGLIEVTLGDPLYRATKDRRLSTTRLIAAPESFAAQQLTTDQTNLSQRIGMNLGGSVRVFGQ